MLQVTISKRAAIIVALAVLLVIPVTAGATHIFTDVADGNVHAPGIEWVANAGVTVGCGDGSIYCPNDPVTRAQMGTFMHRLSGHASGVDPSVDADQVDGLDAVSLQSLVFTGTDLAACSGVTADTNCGSVNVDAPVAGAVVVIATSAANTFGESTRALFGVSDTSATLPADPALAGVIDGADTQRRSYTMAHQAVFNVAAGSHTFYAVGSRSTVFDAQTVNIFDVTMTAIFIPTG